MVIYVDRNLVERVKKERISFCSSAAVEADVPSLSRQPAGALSRRSSIRSSRRPPPSSPATGRRWLKPRRQLLQIVPPRPSSAPVRGFRSRRSVRRHSSRRLQPSAGAGRFCCGGFFSVSFFVTAWGIWGCFRMLLGGSLSFAQVLGSD